jgi:predicted DNA-binding protein
MSENEKTTTQITFRVTESLNQRLLAESKAQKRPLANYIKAVLEEHLEYIDRAKKIAETKR